MSSHVPSTIRTVPAITVVALRNLYSLIFSSLTKSRNLSSPPSN